MGCPPWRAKLRPAGEPRTTFQTAPLWLCLGSRRNWVHTVVSVCLSRLCTPACNFLQPKPLVTEEPGRLQSMGSLSRTRLSDFTFTFHFHALEKEMATHSSVLAWRISGTGEPGGLPSMGSHRVGHDCSDLAAVAAIAGPAQKVFLPVGWSGRC